MAANANINFGKKRSPKAIQLRKQAVLNVAICEFARKGFAGADMDRIASRAKVGKGTIYRYYTNKERLFHAVADEALCRLRDSIFAALEENQNASPFEHLKTAGKASLTFFDKNRVLLEIFLHERSQFREMIHSKYLKIYSEHIPVIEKLVESSMKQRIIRRMDPRRLIDAIGDMLVGLIYMWGVRQEKESLASKWPLVEEIVFKGILAI